MKRPLFYLITLALATVTLTSCGDDDKKKSTLPDYTSWITGAYSGNASLDIGYPDSAVIEAGNITWVPNFRDQSQEIQISRATKNQINILLGDINVIPNDSVQWGVIRDLALLNVKIEKEKDSNRLRFRRIGVNISANGEDLADGSADINGILHEDGKCVMTVEVTMKPSRMFMLSITALPEEEE